MIDDRMPSGWIEGLGGVGSVPPSQSPLTNLAPAILFNEQRQVVGSAPYEVPWTQLVSMFATTPDRVPRRGVTAAS